MLPRILRRTLLITVFNNIQCTIQRPPLLLQPAVCSVLYVCVTTGGFLKRLHVFFSPPACLLTSVCLSCRPGKLEHQRSAGGSGRGGERHPVHHRLRALLRGGRGRARLQGHRSKGKKKIDRVSDCRLMQKPCCSLLSYRCQSVSVI